MQILAKNPLDDDDGDIIIIIQRAWQIPMESRMPRAGWIQFANYFKISTNFKWLLVTHVARMEQEAAEPKWRLSWVLGHCIVSANRINARFDWCQTLVSRRAPSTIPRSPCGLTWSLTPFPASAPAQCFDIHSSRQFSAVFHAFIFCNIFCRESLAFCICDLCEPKGMSRHWGSCVVYKG